MSDSQCRMATSCGISATWRISTQTSEDDVEWQRQRRGGQISALIRPSHASSCGIQRIYTAALAPPRPCRCQDWSFSRQSCSANICAGGSVQVTGARAERVMLCGCRIAMETLGLTLTCGCPSNITTSWIRGSSSRWEAAHLR